MSVTFADAFNFITKVKTKLQNDDAYKTFLDVVNSYRKENKSVAEIYQEMCVIFKDHPDLLVDFSVFLPRNIGFNTFLPKDSHIHPEEDDQTPPKMSVTFDDAFNFITKVKTKLQNDDAYKTFLDVVNSYRKENKSDAEIYQEVCIIFKDHPDLLVDFSVFLPCNMGKK